MPLLKSTFPRELKKTMNAMRTYVLVTGWGLEFIA
jgi:hypothetical protein